MFKVSSEKEVLRRQVSEMTDRVEILEKSTRQMELDNERLAFKVKVVYFIFIFFISPIDFL